jgi:hypothetical protein
MTLDGSLCWFPYRVYYPRFESKSHTAQQAISYPHIPTSSSSFYKVVLTRLLGVHGPRIFPSTKGRICSIRRRRQQIPRIEPTITTSSEGSVQMQLRGQKNIGSFYKNILIQTIQFQPRIRVSTCAPSCRATVPCTVLIQHVCEFCTTGLYSSLVFYIGHGNL